MVVPFVETIFSPLPSYSQVSLSRHPRIHPFLLRTLWSVRNTMIQLYDMEYLFQPNR